MAFRRRRRSYRRSRPVRRRRFSGRRRPVRRLRIGYRM